MSAHAVVFRGEDRPAQDAQPRPETDRSTEAMQRLRNPFDLDLRSPDGARA
ncbi:hypothetical protein [Actinoplanes sp. NPDC026670]|uniref:hypothetical protein n=1 Tax=Actinoplanes sp. NPDC026670 TaxID=3154700 RepID=UPI0033D8F643